MAQAISAPDPHALVTPLLAFLPVSFASARPPPEFLPLLSPILRQRIHVFTTVNASAHEKWTRFLCWDSSKAERLNEVIEEANFEPHPSSGELEVGEVEPVTYQRFDEETLKAQIPLPDWQLTALYLWCNDEGGLAWKLTELLPYDFELARDDSWSSSISEANERAKSTMRVATSTYTSVNSQNLAIPGRQEEDDDDDYWAQYDKSRGETPGMTTPARKQSVIPNGTGGEEDAYYSQYNDVQPAADSYDPDEHNEELGRSTLNEDNIQRMLGMNGIGRADSPHRGSKRELYPTADPETDRKPEVNHPYPSSPSSRTGSDAIARLEQNAERYSASEVAIKQHISTSIKSMFRLARGVGMSRQDFEDMVQRELETLSLLDRDE